MQITNNDKCTGCFACYNKCQYNAITLPANKEGFIIPTIDETLCKKCGLCQQVCPALNDNAGVKIPIHIYAAKANDKELQQKSSSGGIFGVIGEKVINSGGVVYGAVVDKNLHISHKAAHTTNDLSEMYGSKYVQSRIGTCYDNVKKDLTRGFPVLFSGTPCQIAGLKNYLGKEFKQLITVDFICHGVPSPGVWVKYVTYREEVADSKAKNAFFRDKTNGWRNFSLKFEFENGTTYCSKIPEDPYLHAFVQNIMLRECCYDCQIKKTGYNSDITLSDFWGVNKLKPNFYDYNGVSAVFVNTDKGLECFESILVDIEVDRISLDNIDTTNPSRINQTPYNPYRFHFLADVMKQGYRSAYNKWLGDSVLSRINRKIALIFSRNGK